MADKDPDATVVAIFKQIATPNAAKTAEAGRPMYDDTEVVELHYPGSKNYGVFPSTAFSHWATNIDGEQIKITYAERFSRQYQQFKARATQTMAGTPLTHATFLTEARRAELRAQNIYTIEALAELDGLPLKNLGPGGREWKNAALDYLKDAQTRSTDTKLVAELESLRAQNAVMQEDLRLLKERQAAADTNDAGDEFEGMSLEQLREYVLANTGHAPHGSLTRKTLTRMAREAQPKAA